MPDSYTLVSHPNRAWPGARDLFTAQDGWLLCVTRKALFDGCARLLEEGLADADTMVVILDSAGAAAPIAGRACDVLGIARLAAA